jgi:nucleoside-diphosphate-sugar epimerase
MSKLLIIGGTGFFGKSFIDAFQNHLLDRWHVDELILLSRNASNLKNLNINLNRVKLVDADITSITDLPMADYIIHAAASSDTRNYLESGENEKNNITKGVSNFCKIIKEHQIKSNILYLSSGAVYGAQPRSLIHISESYSNNYDIENIAASKRDYTSAKRDSERFIINLSELGFKVSIARCFAFVGPWLPLDQHFAIGNFIGDGLSHRKIKINTKSKVYRSYMYVDDLVIWLMTISEDASKDCPIYNVGSDEAILIDELAQKIGKFFSQKIELIKYNDDTVDRYIPSILKAKEKLGLQLNYSLEQSIEKTITILKDKLIE